MCFVFCESCVERTKDVSVGHVCKRAKGGGAFCFAVRLSILQRDSDSILFGADGVVRIG